MKTPIERTVPALATVTDKHRFVFSYRALVFPTSFAGLLVVLLVLCSAISAQTPDSQPPDKQGQKQKPDQNQKEQNQRRRVAPTLSGPSGLFTIYDGKTLLKGDFTFTAAFTRFDRDPGNAVVYQAPLNFNIGLTDNIEGFFNTEGYRRVKVNDPQLLSSFYLPNSLFVSSPALVLAPVNNRGISGAILRPANNQPPVLFPYVGQPSGNFGIQGTPAFSGTLGVQSTPGGASAFPGIGSTLGSILPGLVFSTATIGGMITPKDFMLAPAYLPDNPFVNRLVGTSSFNSFTFGAKIAFRKSQVIFKAKDEATNKDVTIKRHPLTNFGLIPFYRLYADNANSSDGFAALQRGASAGGNRGDLGLIGFIGSRLSNKLYVSGNLGYVATSDPTSKAFGGPKVTLLSRPDELLYGVAIDSPQDNYQPIFELRGTKYVGGHTPNAFAKSPIELLLGARFYKTKKLGILDNVGIGVAYRVQLNQGENTNGIASANVPISSANVPISSARRNGFVVQVWFGRDRFARLPPVQPNLVLDESPVGEDFDYKEVVLPCPAINQYPKSGNCPVPNPFAPRKNITAHFENAVTRSPLSGVIPTRWESSPGTRVVGQGATVQWDLKDAKPGNNEIKGIYTIAKANGDLVEIASAYFIPVRECECSPIALSVTNAPSVREGRPALFSAGVTGVPSNVPLSINWSVSEGSIQSGQGTTTITVDTNELANKRITATAKLTGIDNLATDFKAQGMPMEVISRICPLNLRIESPSSTLLEGGEVRFTARVDNAPSNIKFQWSVSDGKIIFGDGTSSILVSTNNIGGKAIIVKVQVVGNDDFDPKCLIPIEIKSEIEKRKILDPGRVEIEKTITPVFFGTKKYRITNEKQRETLRGVAEWLRQDERRSIELHVEGNTDPRGTQKYNYRLGNKRARAVKRSLIKMGINMDSIKAYSFGKEKARQNPSFWREDRRVDILYLRDEINK